MLHLLTGSFILGALHALIPNHWMPLVILGRSERWSLRRTLGFTVAAGLAHTSSTILIGLLVGFAGWNLSRNFELYTSFVAPGILMLLGLIYIALDLAGKGGHSHSHLVIEPKAAPAHGHHAHDHDPHGNHHHDHDHRSPHDHSHRNDRQTAGNRSNGLILTGLLTAMFFSPCLEIEAYYLTAASFGWPGILSVSAIYLILTILGMMLLVYLGSRGVTMIDWHFLEHHEKLASGLALLVVGFGAFFIKI